MLDMTEEALRKAVERGHIRCQHVGSRLRFRRTDLMRDSGRLGNLGSEVRAGLGCVDCHSGDNLRPRRKW
jgi:hypothetical protein